MGSLAEAVALIAAARRFAGGGEDTCECVRPSVSETTGSQSSSSISSAGDLSPSPPASPRPERVLELEALLAEKEQRVEEVTLQLKRTEEQLMRLSGRHERQQVLLQIRSLQRQQPRSQAEKRSSRAIRRTYGLLDVPVESSAA